MSLIHFEFDLFKKYCGTLKGKYQFLKSYSCVQLLVLEGEGFIERIPPVLPQSVDLYIDYTQLYLNLTINLLYYTILYLQHDLSLQTAVVPRARSPAQDPPPPPRQTPPHASASATRWPSAPRAVRRPTPVTTVPASPRPPACDLPIRSVPTFVIPKTRGPLVISHH